MTRNFISPWVFLFVLALLAQYTGVAAIVGAFLAGWPFRIAPTPAFRTLTRGVSELLVPFFLAGIACTSIRSLSSTSTVLLAFGDSGHSYRY